MVTLRLYRDTCVCMCPTHEARGQVTLKHCPWWVIGQHQLRQLHNWLYAGHNILDNIMSVTGLFVYLILVVHPQQRARP